MLFIYIHGFNSSSASFKAKCYGRFLRQNHPQDEFVVPELPEFPSQAIDTLLQLIVQSADNSKIALIGSSLGGFYATWLAQKYALKAVLVNPVVNPQELLLNYLGKNTKYYTGEEYEFTREHIKELDAISIQKITSPEKLMVLLQTGDEVLDYHLAEEKYQQTKLMIEPGGDHSFQNFEQHCEGIYQFLTDSKA